MAIVKVIITFMYYYRPILYLEIATVHKLKKLMCLCILVMIPNLDLDITMIVFNLGLQCPLIFFIFSDVNSVTRERGEKPEEVYGQ